MSGSSSRRVFSRSQAQRSVGANNGTFLTECSFGVAHDRLVEVLTDVEPFEPHWEALSTVDLSNRRLESAARLKEFLPALDALNLYVLIPFPRSHRHCRSPLHASTLSCYLRALSLSFLVYCVIVSLNTHAC
jgi:hypothetical protein